MIPPIIDRPDLQSFQQKYGQGLLTMAFWVLFFFFMRPLIGMIGWFFGVELFTDIMIVQGGYHALLELLGLYFGIIVLMGVILEGWARYNRLRYGRNEKRVRQPDLISVAEQARHFGIAPELLEDWQAARRMVLEHDDHGQLTGGRLLEIAPET